MRIIKKSGGIAPYWLTFLGVMTSNFNGLPTFVVYFSPQVARLRRKYSLSWGKAIVRSILDRPDGDGDDDEFSNLNAPNDSSSLKETPRPQATAEDSTKAGVPEAEESAQKSQPSVTYDEKERSSDQVD